MFFGVAGEDIYSSHQDGGTIGGTRPMTLWSTQGTAPRQQGLSSSLIAEGRFLKEWDGEYSISGLGGIRLQNDWRFKWPYFYEVTGGLTHYPGQNLFTLHPGFGFTIPRPNKKFEFFVRVEMPIYFFSGNTEIGTGFSVGLNLPKRK